MLSFVLSSSLTPSQPPPYYDRSILSSDITEKKRTKLAEKHAHLRRCEQLIERKFPQCAPANLGTSCLLEIDDFSRKIAVALQLPVSLVCPRPKIQVLHIRKVHSSLRQTEGQLPSFFHSQDRTFIYWNGNLTKLHINNTKHKVVHTYWLPEHKCDQDTIHEIQISAKNKKYNKRKKDAMT
jgi:hypothetical protein